MKDLKDFQDVLNVILPPQEGITPHVTADFGEKRLPKDHGGVDGNYHGGQTGINLSNPTIHSPISGNVTFAGGGQYGRIAIKDADGYTHELLHSNSQIVKVGQKVKAGDAIGTMGGRGPKGAKTYKEHVHYQIRDPQGRIVNPKEWWNHGGELVLKETIKHPRTLGVFSTNYSAPESDQG